MRQNLSCFLFVDKFCLLKMIKHGSGSVLCADVKLPLPKVSPPSVTLSTPKVKA